MGAVFKAIQAPFQREVAIKKLKAASEHRRTQFINEALVSGRLEHANIVPVHMLGRSQDGEPLLAMKLVGGATWTKLIEAERSTERHIRTLQSVANAIAYAHAEGFLHRDLKPDNVVVGNFGQVYVIDWGLAVAHDRDIARRLGVPHVDDANDVAGTPAYMAPELDLGDGKQQGPHTDVYLLGACLHHILVGEPRHGRGGTDGLRGVLNRAVASEPVHYEAVIPPELAEIANRATARKPEDRYPSVEAFSDALSSYLEHREAILVTQKGHELTSLLAESIAQFESTSIQEQSPYAHAIHRHHAEATFAFRRALELWPESTDARAGLLQASRLLLEHALSMEDLPLAKRLLLDCDEPMFRQRVDRLAYELQSRQEELESLREQARQLDWSAIAPTLSTLFLTAGVGGAGCLLLTQAFATGDDPRGEPFAAVLWVAFVCAIGLLARSLLRRASVRRSLLSARTLGLWGTVAVGCLAVAISNELHGEPPFRHTNYAAILIGVGFAAMAFQARRWLLLPAAVFGVGGIAMAVVPTYALTIFGVAWLLAIGGVGAAIRFGARIDVEST